MEGLDPTAIREVLDTATQGGFRFVKVRQGADEFEAVLSEAHQEIESEDDEVDETTDDAVRATKKVVLSGHVGLLKWVDGIESGVSVHEGDRLGEITALGISNDIVSSISGQIAVVFEPNGAAVDFGKALMEVTVE